VEEPLLEAEEGGKAAVEAADGELRRQEDEDTCLKIRGLRKVGGGPRGMGL
jgi:hypothetical protein